VTKGAPNRPTAPVRHPVELEILAALGVLAVAETAELFPSIEGYGVFFRFSHGMADDCVVAADSCASKGRSERTVSGQNHYPEGDVPRRRRG
jgi:hypothetical protein